MIVRSQAQEVPNTAIVEIKRAYSHKYMCGLGEEPLSDMREPSYSFIDRIIWAVLVIAIIGIGALIVSNLPLLLGLQTHH
jgi:hypothetical protein